MRKNHRSLNSEKALDTEIMCGYNNAPKCVEDFAFISRSITNEEVPTDRPMTSCKRVSSVILSRYLTKEARGSRIWPLEEHRTLTTEE
jgi:hypothetical protein